MANDVSPDSLGMLWDDEDTRAFYENLPGQEAYSGEQFARFFSFFVRMPGRKVKKDF